MAQRSRPSSRRGSARGGSPSSRRGGGAGPLVVATVLVVGVLAAIVFFATRGGDGPAKPPPTPPPPKAGPVAGPPPPPPPPPYPPMEKAAIERAREQFRAFDPMIQKGQELYEEAMRAKNAGRDEEWQDKLRESAETFAGVLDGWNEIIADMPSSRDYDAEEVANHYLGPEGAKVAKALATVEAIKKQRRIR